MRIITRFIMIKQKDITYISHSIISICFVKYNGIQLNCEIKE